MRGKSRPLIKWAGGKSQILSEIRRRYPAGLGTTITKYAEPFIGGGAVLLDILENYKLEQDYISDINRELINLYVVVRDNPAALISLLAQWQEEYLPLDEMRRQEFYYAKRDEFNALKIAAQNRDAIELAALFIFLNRTCFNGLYRVNSRALFNVPAGRYKSPLICDAENIGSVSRLLQGVDIRCADFRACAGFIDEKTFAYFDPPYRPLTITASFTSYSKEEFDDDDKIIICKGVAA